MTTTDGTLWTLDELVELAEQALSVGYDGAPSGRVRDVPDRRLVRWYVTRGLLDRPAAMSGRNALYGRRHLLQLVAIKRRQAEGHSLAQIQAELTGATDPALEQVAMLSTDLPATIRPLSIPRVRFWADRPARPTDQANNRVKPAATWPLRAIELAPGVTLLVDADAGVGVDPDAVRAAATPLLDLLGTTGVGTTGEGRSTP